MAADHNVSMEEWELSADAVVPGWDVILEIVSHEEAAGGRILAFEPQGDRTYASRELPSTEIDSAARRVLWSDAFLVVLNPDDASIQRIDRHYRRCEKSILSGAGPMTVMDGDRLEGVNMLVRRWGRVLIACHDGDPVWIVQVCAKASEGKSVE